MQPYLSTQHHIYDYQWIRQQTGAVRQSSANLGILQIQNLSHLPNTVGIITNTKDSVEEEECAPGPGPLRGSSSQS